MIIQILLVIGVIAVGLFLARPTGGDRHLALRRLFMGVFVLVAVVSILFPQWLSWLANLIGVGRGADLLLYALVLAFLITVATSYRRNVATNRRITQLAREITLSRAAAEDQSVVEQPASAEQPASGAEASPRRE